LNYYIYEKYILGLREINEGPMAQNVEECQPREVGRGGLILGKIVYRIRYLVIVVAFFVISANIHGAMQLETSNKPEQVLKNSNPIQ
jgi:hypothetical protein